MARTSISAEPRALTGKGPNRRLRAAGKVPGVVYGKGLDPVPVSLDPKQVVAMLNSEYGRNSLLEVSIEGEDATRLAIVKEYQVHPWKRKLLHVDLWQITEDTEMLLDIPFKTTGVAPIEKSGARIEILRDYVKVRVKPADLPATITFDLATMPMETQFLHITEVPLPDGVTAVYNEMYSALRVASKKLLLEEEEDEEGEGEGEESGEEEAAAE